MAAFDRETVLIYEGPFGTGWSMMIPEENPIVTQGFGDLSLTIGMEIEQIDMTSVPALLIIDISTNCIVDQFFIPVRMVPSDWYPSFSDTATLHTIKLRTIPSLMRIMLAKNYGPVMGTLRIWAHVQYLTDDAIPISEYVPPPA